jgi:hypothetical protein
VSAAAFTIEVTSLETPMSVGESRESDELRVVFAKPLGATFSVVDDERTVYVTAVWRIS